MVESRSDLSRDALRRELVALLGKAAVCTEEGLLRAASVDRFKKYPAVNGIFAGPIPAAIVSVASASEVAAVLRFANDHLVNVVPRTGGTATEGGLETIVEDTIVIDGSAMNRIIDIDSVNMMATAQCGVPLEVLENEVRRCGLTTGHSPQSKPLAEMGGLTATRSIGQLSNLYGGIEDLVVGLEAVFPDGTVCRVKNVPRRSAGPDIRQIVIGNEGALCFITEVTVKLFAYAPENDEYRGFLVDSMSDGLSFIRQFVTGGYRPAVCRLYSEEDAQPALRRDESPENASSSSSARAQSRSSWLPPLRSIASPPAMSMRRSTSLSSGPGSTTSTGGSTRSKLSRRRCSRSAGSVIRPRSSANWSDVLAIYDSVMRRIRTEFPYAADITMLGAHSSHSYQTGTNLYFVYDYNVNCAPRRGDRRSTTSRSTRSSSSRRCATVARWSTTTGSGSIGRNGPRRSTAVPSTCFAS